ncbi:class I SAM-dependent methyltransferase [Williamsia phyllosphaerae]|uniref:S-adenosyl-L-methionine-dependent methyltransferase n=1 Tax=Williamsia phyllosphaerae TaxID=885042 RepID=A0ABQ1UX78_9NOCA|nr:class I SAM-dependent methyltransferase [Williamsia phyllosphaerae]GGF27402.1 S-adenosyl-L-methionine-dependent methyltransferase [Williamsia phyllosphaerae]
MDDSGPSRTALATAYARAYHQMVDRPRILTDPYAARILGVGPEELSTMSESAVEKSVVGAMQWPRRLFFAARARFAEDRVAAAWERGVRQVVVLGAGMDTFSLRNPRAGLRVFEVDHPATQAWKRRRLTEAGVDVPEPVTFVPVDFETDLLADELESAGMSRSDPTVFVWLGVVYYLTSDAVDATLDYIAGQARPAEVVFDYLQPPTGDEDVSRLRERADRLAAAGEPWLSYFTPTDLRVKLAGLGFGEIDDRSAAEVVDEYTDGTTDMRIDDPQALRASRIVSAVRTR